MIRLTWTGLGIIVVVVYLGSCFGGIAVGRSLSETLTAGILGGALGLLLGGLTVWLLGIALNRRRDHTGRRVWVDRHTFWDVPVQRHAYYFVVLALLVAPCATADHMPKWLTILLWFVCAAVTVFVASFASTLVGPREKPPPESPPASTAPDDVFPPR